MFGAQVRAHRQRLGMSQEELAARTGVSVRGIRNLEAGRTGRPRPGTVRLLADAFELAGRTDQLSRLDKLLDARAARDQWRAALAILTDLDHPDAEQVQARLQDMR